ncbi:MAG: DUF3159 domain-containing protein [Streptosporangiales bacterium]|nr:DUF3159 domain-containing protein [Streptosporangiales bacterium]
MTRGDSFRQALPNRTSETVEAQNGNAAATPRPAGGDHAQPGGPAGHDQDAERAGVVGPLDLRPIDGVRGILEIGLPGVVYAGVVVAAGLVPALIAAVSTGVAMLVLRLVWSRGRRDVRRALLGFAGVLLATLVARQTGRAVDFFLPHLLSQVAAGGCFLVSLAVRWPLIGVTFARVFGERHTWRRDPARLRAYAVASWIWVGMYAVRLAALAPFYLANLLVPLAVGRVVLGWPLYLLAGYLAWVAIGRPAPRRSPLRDDGSRSESRPRAG